MMNTGAQVTGVLDFPIREVKGAKIIPLPLRTATRASEDAGIDKFSLDERNAYLKRYGNHCMSFSAMQPGMHYFDMPGVGYIAFKVQWQKVLSASIITKPEKKISLFLMYLIKCISLI